MQDTTGNYQRLELRALLMELQDDLDDLIGHLDARTLPTASIAETARLSLLQTLANNSLPHVPPRRSASSP